MDMNMVKDQIRQMYSKAIVTGGAGFIGSHIIEKLLDTGIEVVSIDNFVAGKQSNIEKFEQNPRFKNVNCDITDYKELKKHFDGVDIVFHQAASKKNVCIRDPRMDLRVNGEGTFNLLELARDRGVRKFVHASTGSVYGEAQVIPQDEHHPLSPVSYYGVSKLAGERYVKAFEHLYGLDTTILRYFHVYGPRQESGEFGGVIAIFIKAILEGRNPVIFGDGTQERSFTYVDDVANANLFVAVSPNTKGEVYNCASGINITLNGMVESLSQIIGNKEIKPVYRDWTIGDIKKFCISNQKLCSLGFEFQTDFISGLTKTFHDYCN